MITRGTIIGKIIDDLARLISQIELRNKVGLLDLTKISEDFFKELLNIVYDYNLRNLNAYRSNEPGIDLGDPERGIAFQITSTKTSEKLSNTFQKITSKQIKNFPDIKILIIGTKQKKYKIEKSLLTKCNFQIEKDIVDINDLTKEIATLNIDKLELLYTFFQRSFRELIIELEPMDTEGNFESSVYHYVEQIPNNPPKNVHKLDNYYDAENSLEDYVDVYNKLASIPKNQREYVCLIAERGTLNALSLKYQYEISCTKLAGILGIKEEELFKRMAYLEEESIVHFYNDRDEYDRPNFKYIIVFEYLNFLITYLIENKIPLRRTLVAMNFSILEGSK